VSWRVVDLRSGLSPPCGLGVLDLGVHDRVEHGDDLTGIAQRVGDVDVVAHGGADAFGDGGFTVAGRAVHQDRAPRGHRRPELVDHAFGQDQVAHRRLSISRVIRTFLIDWRLTCSL
jgi:hypothetical protein